MKDYSSSIALWFGGLTTTIGTFGVNWHYKRKEFQLREKANVSSSS
ncbi:HP1 family phage holin [Yersinia rohdei]|nr:HP1 family phage holin [Yersinia rohdei]